MKADPETEAAILGTLDQFVDAYRRKDIDGCMRLLAPDARVIVLGTGRDERRLGREAIREQLVRDFAEVEEIDINYTWAEVSVSGDVAWMAAEGPMFWVVGGEKSSAILRRTIVLQRVGDAWFWVHSHASFPPTEQQEGRSFYTPIEAIASAVSDEKPDLRAQAAPDGTVTMLFTDIENSTNLTERLGDTQWLEVLRSHNAIVREQLKAHGCFEVKSQGDGFMAASQSARRAVHCAIGIQQGLAQYNQTAPEPVQVRMGLHTGEVLKEADDFFGKHVILASRIAGKARGGEILASSLLKELTASGGDIRFGPAREVELKGLSGTYQVYDVVWPH